MSWQERWRRLVGRTCPSYADGRHLYVPRYRDNPGEHMCGGGPGYCHHYPARCRCGAQAVFGDFVEEVR